MEMSEGRDMEAGRRAGQRPPVEGERGQERREVGVVGSRGVRVEESQTSVLQAPASGPGSTVNERLIFHSLKSKWCLVREENREQGTQGPYEKCSGISVLFCFSVFGFFVLFCTTSQWV